MPRKAKTVNDRGLLEAALEGLELRKQKIDDEIRQVRRLLGRGTPGRRPAEQNGATSGATGTRATATKRPRRKLSAAARKSIALAQRKRWAEFRKKQGQAG